MYLYANYAFIVKLYDGSSLNHLSYIQVSAWEAILLFLSIIGDEPYCLLSGLISSHIVRKSLYSHVGSTSSNHFYVACFNGYRHLYSHREELESPTAHILVVKQVSSIIFVAVL